MTEPKRRSGYRPRAGRKPENNLKRISKGWYVEAWIPKALKKIAEDQGKKTTSEFVNEILRAICHANGCFADIKATDNFQTARWSFFSEEERGLLLHLFETQLMEQKISENTPVRRLWHSLHNTPYLPGAENDVTMIAPTGESKTVRAGNLPSVLGFGSWDNQDRVLIIGNSTSNTLTLQPLDGGAQVTLADVGLTPTEIAVVPRLERAYITMAGSNEVAVIDYRNQKLVARIKVGQRPVHVFEAPALPKVQHDGEDHSAPELWVGNDARASVSVLDGQSLAVKATVQTGKGHHKLAFADGKVYVSNITDKTVSVIDRLKLKL